MNTYHVQVMGDISNETILNRDEKHIQTNVEKSKVTPYPKFKIDYWK